MDLPGLVTRLAAEARATDERRLLVLHGSREACEQGARRVLDAAGLDGRVAVLSEREAIDATTRRPPSRSGDLLGETYDATVVDCHDACQPNALGRAAGTVDGGGLLVLLAPPLSEWPDRRDGFDESLAVPPFELDDVTGVFRERLVRTLRSHPGVAIAAVAVDDAEVGVGATVERDGLTDPAPRLVTGESPVEPPADAAFPAAAYEACRTADQADAVVACEHLREPGQAVVLTADRGRGKSSAIGLAAGALALDGRDVLVTAPGYRNAREAFARAQELVEGVSTDATWDEADHALTVGGGRVRFAGPPEAADAVADPDAPAAPDVLLVDEAASLPVRLLERYLTGIAVAFATTVHGYEGAGRGFDVRFRGRLAESDYTTTDCTMDQPIRYAGGDPVEVWSFRALMLGARPPVAGLVADAAPGTATYERLEPATLAGAGEEWRLAETFGLLVLAHYRTEPDDLARLLDAPNVAVRALTHDGHPVAVALLAREGGLPAERRARMYEGERVRGNMLPDVLTTQLRDEAAGGPVGVRVLRIATHHAVRSEGLGSRLLDEVAAEFGPQSTDGSDEGPPEPGWPNDPVDYLGVGYGATPRLLRFWRQNGFRTVHLSTTRNDTSGEHSALMMRPLTDAGHELHDRSADWFARRVGSVLGDPLRDADPDVVRATLRAADATVPLDLTDREWRTVAAAAYGPGMYAPAPRPFRQLALHDLLGGSAAGLSDDEERLLVRKALQARPWEAVADELDCVSRRACMRAFGDACVGLVDAYGTDAAREEAARYR
ncbi:tRNA(Met) cytidine acetyltransferase TmcA [Haloglomus litoreum]|uniref:tRNA(Met) cytidine acetyltransferase TmcA n=1 Tax=Haloglomus litoreum TaxID=3034026 RepID=UPI0023E88372|nr:tRNA(Met) cytidine acetyltransferase TmcA [Haloglomus sp. DT116]